MRDGRDKSLPSPCRVTQSGTFPPELILLVPLQCFHVPYSALTMFISREQSERDSATAYRKSIPFPSLPFSSSPCRASGRSALLLQLLIVLQMPCWQDSCDHTTPQGRCVTKIIQGLTHS